MEYVQRLIRYSKPISVFMPDIMAEALEVLHNIFISFLYKIILSDKGHNSANCYRISTKASQDIRIITIVW